MDDTLWVWVICEPFLPLETNESTNYLIMISVTDRPIQHYLLSMELIGLFSSSLFPWQNLKTKYIGRLLKRMKELRLCDKLVEEELASRHHPPFPLRFSLASTDYDDEDGGKNDYGNLRNRPIAFFFLPPVIMMTRMMVTMIVEIYTIVPSHLSSCSY